jgi:hypothetical protein
MDFEHNPGHETELATDEFFSLQPVWHEEPCSEDAGPVLVWDPGADASEPPQPPSLRQDFARELQREFEE